MIVRSRELAGHEHEPKSGPGRGAAVNGDVIRRHLLRMQRRSSNSLAGPHVDPVAGGEVGGPLGGAGLGDGVDEEVVAELVLLRMLPDLRVVGVVEELCAHQRPARGDGDAGLFGEVRDESFPQVRVAAEDG